MAAAQVIGNDTTISIGGQSGNFEINVMMPICAFNLLQSIELLSTSSLNLSNQCISGLQATDAGPKHGRKRSCNCYYSSPHTLDMMKQHQFAKEAQETGQTIKEVSLIRTKIPSDELDKILGCNLND